MKENSRTDCANGGPLVTHEVGQKKKRRGKEGCPSCMKKSYCEKEQRKGKDSEKGHQNAKAI